MALKMESERLSQERHLKEKAGTVALEGYINTKPVEKPAEKPAEVIHTTVPKDQQPQIKTVGQIDLDALNKPSEHKPAEPKPEPKPEPKKPEVQVEENPVAEKVEHKDEEKNIAIEKTDTESSVQKENAQPSIPTVEKPVEPAKVKTEDKQPEPQKPAKPRLVLTKNEPAKQIQEEKPVENLNQK